MKKLFFSLFASALSVAFSAQAGDTITVQTFTFNKPDRSGVFAFPTDPLQRYEKVIMQYSLRCKNGYISTGTDRSKGCGEWDYNCYTYLVDSSRVDSFKNVRPSHDIFNFSGTAFPYTNNKVSDYIKHIQKYTTVTGITNANNGTLGANSSTLNWLGGNEKTAKIQVLWKASELTAAGLTTGNIQSLWLDVSALGGTLKQFKIKLQHTSLTALSAASPLLSGFQEVYFLNTKITATGIKKFDFNTPFNWDGTSNIVVELSYTNSGVSGVNTITGSSAGFNSTIMAKESDYGISFSGGNGQVIELGKGLTITGAKPRTIEGWAYANAFNDGGIWDAGAKGTNGGDFSLRTTTTKDMWRVQTWGGGYDFDVTLAGSQGSWHHYAMVYDGKTLMLYYDGVLVKSQVESINTLSDVFRLGTWSGTTFNGSIDDIRVWDTVIDPAVIKDWMTRKLSPSHPNYSHLKAYYTMDENGGTALNDATSQNPPGVIINNPEWKLFSGNVMFKRFTQSTDRPYVTFGQGTYQITNKDSIVYDTLPTAPRRVIAYKLKGTDIEVVDTTYKTAAIGFSYFYDENGARIDSVQNIAQDTVKITSLNFYSKTPEKIEIINFITPYGINLDLNGLKGKTWEFDVTDYLPVLKGNKFLSIPEAAYQEDMDIRFLFIKGIPPRDVKDVRQIWPSGATRSTNYGEISTDAQFEPRSFQLDATAKYYKIRSSISGHGQEGEFTAVDHTISVNPGNHETTWTVWNTCAENPIFPQGGTWVYSRAGWCPGSAVKLNEIEITPMVTPGQLVTLDYYIPDNPGGGTFNYRVNNQLVTYGAANFSVDAGIEYVRNPSTRVEFSRENPMCNNPVVAIKNTGSTKLESLTFTYGLTGGELKTYNWTGSLNFMETLEVSLPYIDWTNAQSGQFQVEISLPNGQADPYPDNNKAYSKFVKPPVYPGELVIDLYTNNRPNENELKLVNADSKVILYRNKGMGPKRDYSDTLRLAKGCYYLNVIDKAASGGDGLSFWANTAQGDGSLAIYKLDGSLLKSFNPDFGAFASLQFFVADTIFNAINVNPSRDGNLSLNLFPNPTKDLLWFETNLQANVKATLQIVDVMGRVMLEQKMHLLENNTPISISVNQLPAGVYQAVLQNATQKISKRFSVIH